MFDWFRSARPLSCPDCGAELVKWQGKDGPCALLLWETGQRSPTAQLVDDDARGDAEVVQALRLPPTFRITDYCSCGRRVEAEGRCENETCSRQRSRLVRPYNSRLQLTPVAF